MHAFTNAEQTVDIQQFSSCYRPNQAVDIQQLNVEAQAPNFFIPHREVRHRLCAKHLPHLNPVSAGIAT